MKTFAFLFPGQGSQKVGMGRDFHEADDDIKNLFATADSATGLPITDLCFQGPMEALTQTVNLQPAITVVNLAGLSLIRKNGITPKVCAGHSLGEYSALFAAGVVSAGDCLKLVYERGRLMHREASRRQGAMSALIGLEIEQVAPLVTAASAHGIVAVANHNSLDQIVITGEPAAVQAVGEAAAAAGARAVPLKVSGAWHSPLMQGAEKEFRTFLEGVSFDPPQCPVIHNVTAASAASQSDIKHLMARQICSPVRWYDSMMNMSRDGIDVVVEIGPGRVLTGLLKKILPADSGMRLYNVSDLKSAQKFLEQEA